MNDYILSLLLGVIEGLTEFLPVSSTAHLRLAEAWLQVDLGSGYWKMYTIVIQLGAILALPLYFKERILGFLRTFPRGERGDRTIWNHPVSLVMAAFVVTAGPAYLLHKVIGKNLEDLSIIAWALLLGGIVMWIVDALCRRPHVLSVEHMGMGQAIWIGAAQILSAVFPGTSRSMSTIAAGQVAGLSRATALEFSFFLSIPTMVVATGFEFLKTIHPGHTVAPQPENLVPLVMGEHEWIVLAIGLAVSFVVALGVIAWFMQWVRRRGFMPFAVYRIALGGGLLLWMLRSRG